MGPAKSFQNIRVFVSQNPCLGKVENRENALVLVLASASSFGPFGSSTELLRPKTCPYRVNPEARLEVHICFFIKSCSDPQKLNQKPTSKIRVPSKVKPRSVLKGYGQNIGRRSVEGYPFPRHGFRSLPDRANLLRHGRVPSGLLHFDSFRLLKR